MKKKILAFFHDSVVVVHTLVVLYMVVIFIVSITNIMSSMAVFRVVNLVFFSIVAAIQVGIQFIKGMRCPLTSLQDWVRGKLRWKRLSPGGFTIYMMKHLGFRVSQRTLDLVGGVMGVLIFVAYIIY